MNNLNDVTPREWDAVSRVEVSEHTITLDNINHPQHYKHGSGIECIDAIEAQLTPAEFIGYLRGTLVKYNWRLMHKHPTPHADAGKMKWFADRLLAFIQADK